MQTKRRHLGTLAAAAVLAAALPLATAAAPKGGCEPPEGGEVVKDAYEAEVSGGAAPLVTYAGHDYVIDLRGAEEDKADVTITIAWDYTSDWDLDVYDAEGNELGSSIGDQMGGDEPKESVTAELGHCEVFEVRVVNYLADPTSTVQLRVDVG